MYDEIQLVGNSVYFGQTTIHPFAIIAVIFLGLNVFLLSRRWGILPFLVMACFIPSAQRFVIAGADFDFLRIMALFGMIRLVVRKEYLHFVWNQLDTIIVMWAISSVLFYIIQYGTFSAVINRLGFAYNLFGMYFLFRCLIQDWLDVNYIILSLIWISVPMAILFLIENWTGKNMFSIFGGVPLITEVRAGRLRCQGAFSHPILAGCFWASLIPLMAALWWKSSRDRILAVAGIIASFIIVVCCASSTPMMGVFSAIIGGLFFYLRHRMPLVRWMIMLILIALHLVMNGPVWSLIARISAVGGSTGWHRSNLISQTINHFSDWWFCGCEALTVALWGVGSADVTNQYIFEAINGGILTLCLFICIIIIAFRETGKLWRSQTQNPYRLAISWVLGVSMLVHCVNFIGVSYFGQIGILWYLSLAMIGSLSSRGPSSSNSFIRFSRSQS